MFDKFRIPTAGPNIQELLSAIQSNPSVEAFKIKNIYVKDGKVFVEYEDTLPEE